jgi:Na+/melibiose symporter-like transporter
VDLTLEEERASAPEAPAPAATRSSAERLPLSLIVSYGLPLGAIGFMSALPSLYLLKFTTDVLLIAPGVFATVFALCKVGDAFSDPIVGFLSDRTRNAAGRRRPWIFAAAIPMAVTFWAVWSPPEFASERSLTVWIGVALFLYYTAYTIAAVPHLALGAELTSDHHERTRVFGARGLFDILGVLGAASAVAWLQASNDPRSTGQLVALFFAVATGVLLWTSVARVRERPEYSGRGSEAPFKAFADVGRNPHARILLAVVTLETLSVGLLATMFPFVAEYMFPKGAVTGTYVVGALATAVIAFPLWFPLARRLGKRTAWLLELTLKSIGLGCMLLVGPDTMWLLPPAVALIGASLSCSMMLPPSIKSDVIDYDEYVTGERKEGSYFAAWNFAQKLASGAAIALSGLALQLSGYEANAVQDEASTLAIRLLFAGAPLLLHLAAIALLLRFRFNEGEHQRVRAELDRRAAKLQASSASS